MRKGDAKAGERREERGGSSDKKAGVSSREPNADALTFLFIPASRWAMRAISGSSLRPSPSAHAFWFGHPSHPDALPAVSDAGPTHSSFAWEVSIVSARASAGDTWHWFMCTFALTRVANHIITGSLIPLWV